MRLGSLRESPDAFRHVLEDEIDAPADRWVAFLERIEVDANFAVLLADSEDSMAGLSFVGFEPDPRIVSIGGMWVRPAMRRTGVGRALLEAGCDWGRGRGASRARLAVTIGNDTAERLYADLGFLVTGETEPLREGSALDVAWMEVAI